jgi:hypothetical protein
MILSRYRFVFFILLMPLCFMATAICCGRVEPEPEPLPLPETGTLQMNFRHSFDNDSLIFGNKPYIIQAGDTITFRFLAYYISNIKLINSRTGEVFSEPGSYHLVSPYGKRTAFTINSIPLGQYDRVEISVGVDAHKNANSTKSGDLGFYLDMDWNSYTGYDFFIFNGSRLYAGGTKSYDLLYKVNGNQNYKTLTYNLPQTLEYQQPGNYNMEVGVNLANLFRNPHTVSFSVNDIVMGYVNPQKLADNYAADMFRINKISR